MTKADEPNTDPAPETAGNAADAHADDAASTTQSGMPLADLVEQFRAETGYPTEDHKEQERLREKWAKKLAPENVARLSREDLRAYTSNAVDYGRYVSLKEGLQQKWIFNLDDAQYDRLLNSIHDLCWGQGKLSTRIDRLVHRRGGVHPDTGTRGFSGLNVTRTLAICFPESFLPLPTQFGKWGREQLLRVLHLPEPQGSTYGELSVDANDRLREHLAPYFENDTRGMVAFLYWLQNQTPEDNTPNAWMIRGGRHGEFEAMCLEAGLACVGWNAHDIPDLTDIGSRQEIAELIRKALPEGSDGLVNSWAGQLWRFKSKVRRGDFVVMPMKTTSQIALGVVSDEYWYRDDVEPEAQPHVLSVDWVRTDVPRSALKEDLRASLGSQLTVCSIRAKDAAWRLQRVMETGSDPGAREQHSDSQESIHHLAETLLVDAAFLEDIVALLEDKGQVILYGPPGTGKTFLARALAEVLAPDESCRSLVQFHPSTSYEDFFEGYRPAGTGDAGIRYELTPGPLARMAERASEARDERHVMIIDEINRGNLPRVLGELLFLLEYRDESAQTLYRPEDEPFSLPDNLWFIGTMNTADRSIALVDAALRRRFHFVPFFPDSGPMAGLLGRWLKREGEPTWIGDLVDRVNAELAEVLEGSHLLLGPSHFMKKYGSSSKEKQQRLRRIWEYNIEPFIEDQFFGDPDQIARFRFDAVMNDYGLAATSDSDANDGGNAPESTGGPRNETGADGEDAAAEHGPAHSEGQG